MAEMLVDSTKLDACLDAEADAIRAKTGGSADIAFDFANNKGFADAIAAIPSGGGGDSYEIARRFVDGTITEYVDSELTKIRGSAFRDCFSITKVSVPNVKTIGTDSFNAVTTIAALAFPSLTGFSSYALRNFKGRTVDLGPLFHARIMNYLFDNCTNLETLIFRYNGIVPLMNIKQSMPSKFLSGGAGGTIYIPKAMYDHLGDGSALDYKSATNWSTIDGYGTITWAQIEGSIYETQYADGTPIPSE